MVNELCELAASGLDTGQLTTVAVLAVMFSVIMFVLSKKQKLNAKWLLPVFMLVFTITAQLQQTVFAGGAMDCEPSTRQSNSQVLSTAPGRNSEESDDNGETEALGGLIDDNPDLVYDEDFGEFFATFAVLPNDNAPDGDGFDITTLQLLGDYPHPEYPHTFLILDPENPVPPETPNFPGNPDWDNVWGQWSLELTCDPDDTDHCYIFPDDSIVCYDPSAGTCWPTGDVIVYFNNLAQPGVYSIQYTVNTESGATLLPATITVSLPVPSPITAQDSGVAFDACFSVPWDSAWSLDIMSLVSTTGTGALLPSTIDLDPDTPGIQSTVTYGSIEDYNLTTYVVDGNGIVTMTAPVGDEWGERRPKFGFRYTISDDEGNVSNVAEGVEFIPEFEPSCGQD